MLYGPLLWLKKKGFKAYLVGNQVRAILLKKEDEPSDIDIATTALPGETLAVLRREKIIPTFVDSKFGVVDFVWAGINFSITTLREDIYSNKELARFKRYPSQVRFVKELKKDALRRDLTINAIYYDPVSSRFFDPTKGLSDWRRKMIRVVGDPQRRFEEDPLRILRAIRFKNSLGFRYHPKTLTALQTKGYLVRTLPPRVRAKELLKIKESPHFQEALKEIREFGIFQS